SSVGQRRTRGFSHRSNHQERYKKQVSNSPNQIEQNERTQKMTQQQRKRYFYISQLSWESRKLKTQKQPQERSRKVESSSRNKVEKGNSTAAAAKRTRPSGI